MARTTAERAKAWRQAHPDRVRAQRARRDRSGESGRLIGPPDPVMVARLCDGRRLDATQAERRAAVEKLWYVEGLTRREIADRLGMTYAAAKKATERANQRHGAPEGHEPWRWWYAAA